MDVDSLDTVGEIAATLAGFAVLAGLVNRDFLERHYVFGIVETSLISLVFSILPRVVVSLRVAALIFLLVWTAAFVRAFRRNRAVRGRVFDRLHGHPAFVAIAIGINVTGSALSLLAVLAIWPEQIVWLYQSAVVCPLLLSCMLLWQILSSMLYSEDERNAR